MATSRKAAIIAQATAGHKQAEPDEMKAVAQSMPQPNARAGWDSRLNVRYDPRARGHLTRVLYAGRRVAPIFEGMEEEINVVRGEHIDVTIPDAKANRAAVARYLAPIIPPGATHEQAQAALKELRPDDIHLTGPQQYHFIQGEASDIVDDDWPFLESHPSYVFVRLDD